MTDSRLDSISINHLVAPKVIQLAEDAHNLRIGVSRTEGNPCIIDAGIEHVGGIEAGRQVAEICMGGLGHVRMTYSDAHVGWPVAVHVHTQHPVLACLASQYAGWKLHDKKSGFFALASGPARALAQREELFGIIDYTDSFAYTALVLEVNKTPPDAICEYVTESCGIPPENLTLILTPTTSLAGAVQIVGRVLEVALHKAHELGFDLNQVVDGIGSAPLPPISQNISQMMGRTNDAILFGGQIKLYVQSSDDDAEQLAKELPSSSSRDYGKPFAEIFQHYDHDFFQIDPMLFSPASVMVNNIMTGRSFSAGSVDSDLLHASFLN